MMAWAMVIALAVAAFAVLVALFKAPRRSWEAIAAALIFGLAGFAFQARPAQPGAPKDALEAAPKSGQALVEARHQFSQNGPISRSRLLITADALSRNGSFGDAASLALGAAEEDPNNADAWLALAINLVAHSEGNLTPAALYAFRRTEQLDPKNPGLAFFLGLALAQNGQLDKGRALWVDLLAREPKDAPWREDVELRLAALDQFIASRAKPAQ
jgi:cytochrome c-type biogenesis protein CcmH